MSGGLPKIPPSTSGYKNTSTLAQVETETGAGLPEFAKEELMGHTRNWHLNLWRDQLFNSLFPPSAIFDPHQSMAMPI